MLTYADLCCEQITVENLNNRANDQFVNVRANNVDSNRVSLHNHFYLVRTRMLTYADVRMPTHANVSSALLFQSTLVCQRMLTYADVC